MSDHLPQEVLIEILAKLPVKSLIKFSLVCKSWNALIKSPDFITTHLQKTLNSENNHCQECPLLLFSICLFKDWEHLHFLFMDEGEKFTKHKQLRFLFQPYHQCTFVGSCNGLICVRCVNEFVIWNPSIQRFIRVPPLNDNTYGSSNGRVVGFGFDPASNDYKIVRILQPIQYYMEGLAPIRAELYSLNSNSWKIVDHYGPRCTIYNDVPIHVNGALHWIGKRGWNGGGSNVLVVFHMGNEVFREIVLPEQLVNLQVILMVFGDSSLAVTFISVFSVLSFMCDIWVMKTYGVASSWERLPGVEIRTENDPYVWGFRKNGELLLEYDKCIVSVNPDNQQFQPLRKFTSLDGFVEYVDYHVQSLVLLDKETNISNEANITDATDSSDADMTNNTSDESDSDDSEESISDSSDESTIADDAHDESDATMSEIDSDESDVSISSDASDNNASDGSDAMDRNN